MPRVIDPYDPIMCWQKWTDVLGQTFGPGDYIAYASISGRSPQQVIAKVVRINRFMSNGALIKEKVGDLYNYRPPKKYPPPSKPVRGGYPRRIASLYTHWCSITVIPIIDARGFYRANSAPWASQTKKDEPTKPVTLHIPQNVVKVDWKPCDDHDPTR